MLFRTAPHAQQQLSDRHLYAIALEGWCVVHSMALAEAAAHPQANGNHKQLLSHNITCRFVKNQYCFHWFPGSRSNCG